MLCNYFGLFTDLLGIVWQLAKVDYIYVIRRNYVVVAGDLVLRVYEARCCVVDGLGSDPLLFLQLSSRQDSQIDLEMLRGLRFGRLRFGSATLFLSLNKHFEQVLLG